MAISASVSRQGTSQKCCEGRWETALEAALWQASNADDGVGIVLRSTCTTYTQISCYRLQHYWNQDGGEIRCRINNISEKVRIRLDKNVKQKQSLSFLQNLHKVQYFISDLSNNDMLNGLRGIVSHWCLWIRVQKKGIDLWTLMIFTAKWEVCWDRMNSRSSYSFAVLWVTWVLFVITGSLTKK